MALRLVLLAIAAAVLSLVPMHTAALVAAASRENGDGFDAPPARLPSGNGVLIKSAPLTAVPMPEGARAWKIQYTTTLPDGTRTIATATVLAPSTKFIGPRPVVTWEHGTTGIMLRCMPSHSQTPFRGIPALNEAIALGWVIVSTDYQGPIAGGPHPYIIGEGEARAGLDATRAAHQLHELKLQPQTVVWGHSQGGHAALWTGIVRKDYAPDVPIVGVAAISPATDFARLTATDALSGDLAARQAAVLAAYVTLAYSQYYPDVKLAEEVRPQAASTMKEFAEFCLGDAGGLATMVEKAGALDGAPPVPNLFTGPLGRRLKENIPDRPIEPAVLIVHGMADNIIPESITEDYVNKQCAAGQALTYLRFEGIDHNRIVSPGSALTEPLIEWTKARFAGEAQPSGCIKRTVK